MFIRGHEINLFRPCILVSTTRRSIIEQSLGAETSIWLVSIQAIMSSHPRYKYIYIYIYELSAVLREFALIEEERPAERAGELALLEPPLDAAPVEDVAAPRQLAHGLLLLDLRQAYGAQHAFFFFFPFSLITGIAARWSRSLQIPEPGCGEL